MSNTGMNMRGKITFYEEKNFQGRSYECMNECSDMTSNLSRCQSCRVESGCFMVYDRSNYMGNQCFMKRGEYSDYMSMMGMRDCIKSCRMIPMQHRGQYRMKIYEKENFGGQSHELMEDCDNIMDRYRMNECQSCNVMDGHWLMYEQPQFRGKMMYMRPGEYRNFMDMGMSGQRFMSMRRYQFTSNSTSTANMSNTGMNMRGKITFYEEKNFQGRSYECMNDCPDMTSNLSRCQSCRVESGCFMVYDRSNYMGNQCFMKRGEYSDYMSMMGMRDCIKSCRMIPMQHRGQFRMKIYEKENFGGQSHEMMEDCDNIQERYRMNECQSCNVMDGHWLMYEQPQFRGKMMYMRPGEYRNFMDMGMSGQRFMSMRRITDSCN
ncbi:hypothetical protein NQZ68_034573 [Dissostichus eleginoides]|nr:hypothetical protein NQZ68_034573 [Dissostichus eleginoides]